MSTSHNLLSTQDTSVKQNLIRCAELIAQTLHPDHLDQDYNFTTRGEFLVHMQVPAKYIPDNSIN